MRAMGPRAIYFFLAVVFLAVVFLAGAFFAGAFLVAIAFSFLRHSRGLEPRFIYLIALRRATTFCVRRVDRRH